MNLYNTVDVEITDHWLSYSENLETNILLPYIKLAELFCERAIKSTFFVSIAPKSLGIDWSDYDRCLDLVCRLNRAHFSEYIRIQPHMHCLNLPLPFTDKSDYFSDYDAEEQCEILAFGKRYLEDRGLEVDSFRPGGFRKNEHYYEVLERAGYRYSSTLDPEREASIDLVTGAINDSFVTEHDGILEFPVTSVHLESVKGGRDLVNLSPDFFIAEAIAGEVRQLRNVVLNFHSFSLFHSRPVRERFPRRRRETLKHLLREFLLKRLARPLGVELLTATIYRDSLESWLELLRDDATWCWIGERPES